MKPAGAPLGLGELFERGLLTAVLAATLSALAAVARNRLAPSQSPLTIGLVLWCAFAVLYAAVLAPLLVVAGAALRRWAPALVRPLVAAVALGFLVIAAASNRPALAALLDPPGGPRARWAGSAAALLGVVALASVAIAPAGRRRVYRALAAAALAAAAAAFFPEPRPAVVAQHPVAAGAARVHGTPLVVIGVDGADWRLLEPLLERGELPHLQELRRQGASGPLKTLKPTISPPIWTTIATGRSPRGHGVKDFTFRRLAGVHEPFPQLAPLHNVGSAAVLAGLEAAGVLRQALITSALRRVPAFWNIATFHRSPIAVVGWWATWPAEPVLGFVVSERAYYEELATRGKAALPAALGYPPTLMDELRGRIVLPDQVTIDDVRPFVPDVTEAEFRTMQVHHPSPLTGARYELTYNISVFETSRRLALELIERGKSSFAAPPDLFVLFKLVDGSCHSALRYSELVPQPGTSDDDQRLFRSVVTGAYRRTDDAVGEILAAVGEANVVVLSDHGFNYDGGRFNHDGAPDGVLIASGPAFRQAARLDGLSVYDVMPLLLQARGLPLAEDLEGRLPSEAFAPGFLEKVPVRSVKTYGRWGAPQLGSATPEADRAAIEQLKALGYLQ